MFDRNMDGYIDMSELRKMFAMVGVGDGGVFSRDEMEEFMEEADRVSGKWSVSVNQFAGPFSQRKYYTSYYSFRMEMENLTTMSLSRCSSSMTEDTN